MLPFLQMQLLKFTLLFCLLLTSNLQAQTLSINPLSLDFGTNTENILDSLPIQISNIGSQTAHVSLSIPFEIYGSTPYSIPTSSLSIEPGQIIQVNVRCRIIHNTPNPAALIISTPWSEDGGDHCVKLSCQGNYSKAYYSSTQNQEEETLKQTLKIITGAGYTGFSYDVARDKMYASIDNQNDTVTCVYTNRKAKFNTRATAVNNNFNCEHTFPQSLFGQNAPMRSDLHHLFSTDDAANNSRGNLPFGVAVAPLVSVAVNAPSKNGGGLYEPQDLHKGACARAMMYFVTRYEDYTGFFAPQEAILRQWNKEFPPLPKDIARNEAVFAEQNNRNPFTDYPQFADRIRILATVSSPLDRRKLGLSDSILYSQQDIQPMTLALWNEGKLVLQIQNIRFLKNRLKVEGNSNFDLAYNSATKIRMTQNPDSTFSTAWKDTLAFETNDPLKPIVRIPWRTGLIQANEHFIQQTCPKLSSNPEGNFKIVGIKVSPEMIEARDLVGRKRPIEIVDENTFSIPQAKAGLYFIHIQSQGKSHQLRYLKP